MGVGSRRHEEVFSVCEEHRASVRELAEEIAADCGLVLSGASCEHQEVWLPPEVGDRAERRRCERARRKGQ